MPDFYKEVPKTLKENLAYRVKLRDRAGKDPGFRRAMLTACRYDILFWLNAWTYLYEPRTRYGSDGRQLPKIIPFITWPHQEPVILEIKKHLGSRDIGIEKSRGEGMSWIGILLALHDWLFDPGSKVGLVSSTEKKADDPGNMDSLLAKVDWELTKLPKWMAGVKDVDWKRNISDHSLVNLRNFSQINAFAATADAGRGGRYKWFMPDELAFWESPTDSRFMTSIRGATESRLVISTPNGNANEYASFMHTPSNVVRLTLDWKDNPTRNRGLYVLEGGKPVAVNPDKNPLAPEYDPPTAEILDLFSRLRNKGFTLEGRQRSPWYDNECDRADSTPRTIAQELDRDYGGSKARIFTSDFIAKVAKSVRLPVKKGTLIFHPETLEPMFSHDESGQLLLWTNLDVRNRPPAKSYVVGCDISSGLGGDYTSNSTIEVIDLTSMEQVAELASNTIQPADFADLAIAISKWFHGAFLAWEANGPGNGFGRRVLDQKYGNIYCRTLQWKRVKKQTKEAGWWTDMKSKELLFSDLLRMGQTGELTIRSDALSKEFSQYIRIGAKIEHELSATTMDDGASGAAHGDRVIALGVAVQASKERPSASVQLKSYLNENPPPNTMAWRQKEYEDSLKEKESDWDDRTHYDMAMGVAWKSR